MYITPAKVHIAGAGNGNQQVKHSCFCIMEMCINGYCVMDNSMKQPVIRHFHNACACGIHPFHSVFLQKQIFCRLRKTLHICKAFLFSFCPLHRTFSFCKIHFTKLHLPFCKISFSPDKFQLLFLYPMIQIFYYSLCPISDTVHFLNPFPLIFMLLFICTELYQIKRNKKDMIS